MSYETPGNIWRKESIESDDSEFPEAADLLPGDRTLYVGLRLEQQLLRLRWLDGNLSTANVDTLHASLDGLAAAVLAKVPSGPG